MERCALPHRWPRRQRFAAQLCRPLAEQRSSAQVGLGPLAALPASRQLSDQTPSISAALIHASAAEHLLLLSPGPQVLAAQNIAFAAQGQLDLASAEPIRLYAKTGITWHTEGESKASLNSRGKGGSRTDIISQGNDQTQVQGGAAHYLAQQDLILEFRGQHAVLSTQGVMLELTQAGTLTLTANTDIVVEASSHEIGGAKDWGSGSGKVTPLSVLAQAKPGPAPMDEELQVTWPFDHSPVRQQQFEITRADSGVIPGTTDGQGNTGLQNSQFLDAVHLRLHPNPEAPQ
ncbi:hypothetical protein [Roseateles koreensis]|uniref:DUF2345 domain-containing protein n=1 Tax=Roseateles koreensis TaxID=2987526 RepID=A0ABT5KSK2_9BURK|nr:hypothetical protein [Roseateles koreensis]MDC8785318.1 hypothetical protein [Roseateles koreensis]